MATGNMITTNTGQSYNYDDVVNLILSKYAEGKTPALAVKSALQLGFPEDVIRTLPGVDAAAFEEGKRLIESGAFASTATGTVADVQQAAPVGSAQYNARIAAGLDAFGFPPEEVARLTAAGLYGPGRQYDPGTGGLFNQENRLAAEAEQVLLSSGKANDPRFADSIVGTFVDNGVVYNVQGDGSFTTISETPDQVVTTTTFTPEGQEVATTVDDRFQTTDLDRFLELAANAALAAGTAAGLGPAGVGLFGVPGAAAAGAGTTNLIRTGSVEDALKAAALAGATAYGIQGLMGGGGAGTEAVGAEDLSVYDDIRQLKAAGIPDSQIAQIVEISYNATPEFAASAINQVASSTAAPAATETVALESSRLFNPATLAAPAIATLPSTFVAEPVTVQGQNLPQSQVTVQDLLAALTPELVAPLPAATGSGTQTVEIPGSKTTATENIISSLVPALTTAAIPAATQAATQSTAPERVEVTAKKDTSLIPSLGAAVTAALPTIPADIKAELPKPLQPTEKSLFTPSDLLKLIGLLGGAGAGAALSGTGAGTGVGTLPPSDTRIGSTTPQYGSDYYNAVQRYYNAYMPETPRDVAGPLQQWYENTYGTAPATGPGVGAIPGTVTPVAGTSINQTIPSIPTMRPQMAVEGMPGVSGDGFYGVAPAQRPQLQSFRELPAEQQKQGADYLASVVPLIAQRSIQSGTGWGDFSQLSQNFRARPEDLLSYMTPDQKKEFESRFNYQLGTNSRLFDPERTFTQGSATFQPNVPQYLTQASQLASQASPEQRAELERIIYSGATQGGTPALIDQGLFNVPWWVNATKAEEAIAGLYSGNPQQYFQQQALQKVQAPLSETFSDASRRTIIKGPGGFDISFSKDGTPYIEAVNLFGDRPIERLRETYGLNDQQISELISMIPLEAFNPNKRASEEFGYIPSGLKPYYKGYKEPSGVVPEFKPEDVPRLVREGLIPPGS